MTVKSQRTDNGLVYVPPPTIEKFMQSDHFVRVVVGPLGSGKSMGMIMELLRRATEQAPDAKGVRPTRFVIIRNTLQQIRQTCLADIKDYLGPMMNFKVSDSTVYFDFPCPDGTRVQSEWLMVPIENAEDQKRLLSLQLTGAWISECREVNFDIVGPLLGRLGRFPAKSRVEPTWQGLIAETNPWAEGSAWHEKLIIDPDPNWALFRQPGGRDQNAENLEHLPPGYYERLMRMGEKFSRVHVDGEFGEDVSGQVVFGAMFDRDRHIASSRLTPTPGRPLTLAFDFGRTPTCLITQHDHRGRLLVLKEFTSEDMGLRRFLEQTVMPGLRDERFARAQAFVVADPTGSHKNQTDEISAFNVLEEAGFSVYGAPTNDIGARLRAVEALLLQARPGGPGEAHTGAILIDPEECPLLIRAMGYEYRYRRKNSGELEDKPEKKHPWSDLADCLQYAAMSINGNYTARHIRRHTVRRRETPFSARAWT